MTNLEDLQKKINKFRDARKWRKFHAPKDAAIGLFLEAAELIEHFQWKNPEDIKKYLKDPKNKEAISDEVIDVLYWLLIIASDFEIDIGKAFERKMKKNAKKYPVK